MKHIAVLLLGLLPLSERAVPAQSDSAKVYRDADDLEKAERQYQTVVGKHPRSAEALVSLARVEVKLKKYPSAAQHFQRALALAPNSEELLYDYALVFMRLNKPREASQALESAVHMGPESGAYLYLLGLAYLQAGELAEAVAALQHADQAEPDRACTFAALGLALFGQKRYGEASTALERSLALYPGQQQAIYLLARIAQAQGNVDRARVLAERLSSAEDKSRALKEETVYRASETESSELSRLVSSLLEFAQAQVEEDAK